MIAIVKNFMSQVRQVNRKYAKAEIEMTPVVRFCLLALRLYLVLLVGLMVVKFIIAARS